MRMSKCGDIVVVDAEPHSGKEVAFLKKSVTKDGSMAQW